MDEKIKQIAKFNLWNDNEITSGYKRTSYLQRIDEFIGNKLIKVLVGQRRAGKSYILRQIANHLVAAYKVPTENILYINKEFLEFDFIETYKDLQDLFQLYQKELNPKGKIYILLDEVQNIAGWEKFVNAYAQNFTEDYELFITGSNSNLVSGELATLLVGRYVEFTIFPYSYREYTDVEDKQIHRTSYLQYLQLGGLPQLFDLKSEIAQKQYVASVKDTIMLRDIAQRNSIRDINLLHDVFIYVVNNASNLFSITNLVNYFSSKNRKTSYDTIANYLALLEQVFLIHQCNRYRIKGKEIVGGTSKYYVNDVSFRNLLYSGYGYGIGYLLENTIYLELMRRGYGVYTGENGKYEVDFVAVKDNETIYIQCSYLLEKEETFQREIRPLQQIKNHYEKIIISTDEAKIQLPDGIKHFQAWEF